MSVDNVDARLAWRLAPEVVFTPSLLDFGQVDRGFKKVRAVYVSNFSGPIDRSAVSCSEGTSWFRIVHVQPVDDDPTTTLRLMVEIDTTLLAAGQTYTGWIEVQIEQVYTRLDVKATIRGSLSLPHTRVPWLPTFGITVAAMILVSTALSLLSSERAVALTTQLFPDLLASRPWPDHNRLSFSTYERQGLTLHLTGSQVGYQQNLGVVGWFPAWSLDGTQLAYFAESGGAPQLYMMNAADETPIQLTASATSKSALAWAPDGRSVAFLAGQPEQTILNIIDSHAWSRSNGASSFMGSDKLSRAVNTIFRKQGEPNKPAGYTRQFAWSPNSKALLFDYYQEQQTRILQVNTNGDIVEVATDSWHPSWSPDGTAIAAVAAEGLFRMAITGQDRFYLTRRQVNAPAWSPDGQRIAFLADNETADGNSDPGKDHTRRHTRDLWVIDTTGENETFLAEGCVTFVWSPDSQQLAYVTGDGQGKPPIYYLWTMILGTGTTPTLLAEINDPSIAWKLTP